MLTRKLAAIVAVLIPLGLTAPAAAIADASAGASATPDRYAQAAPPSPLLTFIPPRVGPLRVELGPTFINGQLISPGVDVSTPGISLPPITWPPSV